MKNNIKRLLILTTILIIISTSIILINGKTYTTTFNLNHDNNKLSIDNDTGKVEILDEKTNDNKYIVKVKAIKPGRVFLRLENGEFTETTVLYVHKSLVITDNNFFGKSTSSEVIPLSLSILLIYSLYILINKYKKSINYNLYQYKNIAYLGTIIFMIFFIINIIISIFNFNGVYDIINKTINSISEISIILFPIALITFILVTISNIQLIRKEGKSLKNLLGVFLGVFLCISTILPNYVYGLLLKSQSINIFNLNSIGPYIYNLIESIVYLSISYLECLLISTIIIAIKCVKKKIEYNKDYIIILGCRIKKDGTLTPLLKGRVDIAINFRNKQLKTTGKDLIIIASGGKGNDEIISEGEAIKNYLIKEGINKKNILVDDKSKNTYENIKFSNNLINKKHSNILLATTNYHVLRAGLIATEQGLLVEGIGSKTKNYFWINAFIREFIGTLYSEKKKHIIVITIIIIALIIMNIILYFANNI